MKKIYIETYGCQMNLADTEVVLSILKENDFTIAQNEHEADVILLNTCSVRDNAEQRIYGRIGNLKTVKREKPAALLGIIGCMAERLKDNLTEQNKAIDLIVGPDEYRRLPELIARAEKGNKGIGVQLSRTETYDDIVPYREDGLSAWISVMRGCDKFCTFCVVPFTRGRERSRSLISIVEEVKELSKRGFKEITLLGQNVNSYHDNEYDFADLLSAVAKVDNTIRIRYTTSHPQDLSEKLLNVMAENANICNYIHLPVQSGSNRILELMNRTYTIDHYLNIVEKAKQIIPGVSFSTDIISGFPTETEEDHLATLEIMKKIRYDSAFMFKYSPREGTKAYKMKDDVDEATKSRRLTEIIDLQQKISSEENQKLIGKVVEVLVENYSRKSVREYSGRTDTNKTVVFPVKEHISIGNYVQIKISKATSSTLIGEII